MAEYKEAMDHNFGRQLSPEDAAEITKAVSYTHLDVYKRQDLIRLLNGG